MQVDLAMPTNLTDPASSTKYFQAATLLSKAAAAGTNVSQIQPIPFFENIFPGWAGAESMANLPPINSIVQPEASRNPTATQDIYELWTCFPHNETFSLFQMDLPALHHPD